MIATPAVDADEITLCAGNIGRQTERDDFATELQWTSTIWQSIKSATTDTIVSALPTACIRNCRGRGLRGVEFQLAK